MGKLIALYRKYKDLILYVIFGGLTTLVNIVAYYLLARVAGMDILVANVIAWFVSVIFAYVTNKIWVFESKSCTLRVMIWELLTFFAARLFSGALDMFNMWMFVDVLHINDMVIKILSNIVVIIINYVLSKFWIFKKKKENHQA